MAFPPILRLTPALIDALLFAMEDQKNDTALDLSTGTIITGVAEDAENVGTLVPLPDWSSWDGFQTMRGFSNQLQDPLLRTQLNELLDGGQGVFKAYKALLKEHGTAYRRWLVFKRRIMQERVRDWIQGWKEAIEWPSGDSREAIEEDFSVVAGCAPDQLLEWRDRVWKEAATPPELWGVPNAESWQTGDLAWKVVGPEGIVGVVWARSVKTPQGEVLKVLAWYVLPDFRGLGLGKLLWETLTTEARRRLCKIFVLLPQNVAEIGDFFVRFGGVLRGSAFEF